MYNLQHDFRIALLNFGISPSLCGDFWGNWTCIIYDLTNEQVNYFIQAFSFVNSMHTIMAFNNVYIDYLYLNLNQKISGSF